MLTFARKKAPAAAGRMMAHASGERLVAAAPAVQRHARAQALMGLSGALNAGPSVVAQAKLAGSLQAVTQRASGTGVAQMRWFATIRDSARRHYHDGWGDAMGITSDEELKNAVWDDSNEADGYQEIDFGNCVNGNEYISRPCAVGYSNRTSRGGHTQATIFHCGPSSRGRFA